MRILWLKTELLHPVDKGGKIRTYHMLRELRRHHRITYLALDDAAHPDAAQHADEYCDELVRVPFRAAPKRSARFYAELALSAVSPLPYAVWKYRSPEMRRRIAERATRGADVLVCDFLFPSVNVPRSLGVPSVLFQHNVEAVIWRRHAEVATNGLARAYLREQWRRMRAFERAECRRYDHVVAVSEQDRDVFRDEYGVARVSAVPTGVDTAYFRAAGRGAREAGEIVFTGSMDWLPNEDAVMFFVEQVLPRIRRAVPEASLTVVGRSPTPRVLALADAVPGVRVTGRVADVRPYLERAGLFVVPIRVGGGTRLKIYEAMAMGCPVVSTTVGAEGLPVRHGEHLLLADGAEAFAEAAVSLLTDPGRAAALARRAEAAVRAECGWDRVAARFAEICERAAAERTAVAPTDRGAPPGAEPSATEPPGGRRAELSTASAPDRA